MRLSIERLRTLVLAAGVLLIAALGVFLAVGKWRNPLSRRDLPKRLGVDIQQEASGFTYTQARGGHTLFRIQASKVVQLKQGYAMLHEVRIEIFGANGTRMDSIQGNEFEYNQQEGTAKANGPVEITLTRPSALSDSKSGPSAPTEQMHVKTSGLVFDQNSGLASTKEQVEFDLVHGSGSAKGATFDSEQGLLVLDRAVRMVLRRGADTADLQAAHAEFERAAQTCRLAQSVARYRGSQVESAVATIHFRDDGSAAELDVEKGLSLTSATGSRITAPTGTLLLDEENHPRSGRLSGGVALNAASNNRKLHAEASTAVLDFSPAGVVQRVHLEDAVRMVSDSQEAPSKASVGSHGTWTSPVADLTFRETGPGQVELASLHGSGGVIVTNQSQRGTGPITPFRMQADAMTGTFGPGSALTSMTGEGHARMEQTTVAGVQQSTSGDRIVANFAPKRRGKPRIPQPAEGLVIDSAKVEGNVVVVEVPAAQPGRQKPTAMRATGSKAIYLGASSKLQLTGHPRVEDGGMQLTAQAIELTQLTGDAAARGNVKVTWQNDGERSADGRTRATGDAITLGGQAPTHAVADEARLHEASGEIELRGSARLWQSTSSISAPVIVLDRSRQTLQANATGVSAPVRVVLVSAAGPPSNNSAHSEGLSVIRMRGGDLKYSAAERKAVVRGGILGSVVVETADTESSSSEVEVYLLPPGNHSGKNGAPAQVDRLVARGHVILTAQGRTGSGEMLEYRNDTGEYVLTGTSAQPPRLSDPVRGSVSGEVLIFNSGDDSVKVESARGRTMTETAAPSKVIRETTPPEK